MKFLVNKKLKVEGFDNALALLSRPNDSVENLGYVPLAWYNEKGQLEYRLDLKENLLRKCRLFRAKQRV